MTWTDIDAFTRRAGVRLAPWEIRIIERLDDLYLTPEAKPPPPPEGEEVIAVASPSNASGVRALLGSIGRRVFARKKE